MSWKPSHLAPRMQVVLAELDDLLRYCKENSVTEDIISDINMKTISYIKKCKKQKASNNIKATKRYLKEKELLAVPFDKGVGICLMKKGDYETKLDAILQLPSLRKWKQKEKMPNTLSAQKRSV